MVGLHYRLMQISSSNYLFKKEVEREKKLRQYNKLNLIATIHGITLKNRKQDLKYKQHYFCWFVRNKSELTLKEIGSILNKDHATVLHSIRSCENLLSYEDKDFMKAIKGIQEDLKGFY